jgi:hypothetical protein
MVTAWCAVCAKPLARFTSTRSGSPTCDNGVCERMFMSHEGHMREVFPDIRLLDARDGTRESNDWWRKRPTMRSMNRRQRIINQVRGRVA